MVPTYQILTSLSSVNEGQTLLTMVHTTGVANGTVLYWQVAGTNITAADFSSGLLIGQGTVAVNASGAGMFSIAHTLANDLLTEGTENLQIRLFSDPARTKQVAISPLVAIRDTSLTAALPPTYSIKPSLTSLDEGVTLTTTVQTTNLKAGSTVYWTVSGTGITPSDFSSGAMAGMAAVDSNGRFSFSHAIANDLKTEGSETLQIKLFSDSTLMRQVGSTATVSIRDTSLTPVLPAPPATAVVTPSVAAINEGGVLTTTVQTTNIKAGTLIYWRLSGVGIDSADLSAGALIGSTAVDASGRFTLTHTLANDLKTEGVETLLIQLFSDAARSKALGNQAFVKINDTSLTPPPPPKTPTYVITPSATVISEGALLTTRVQTTNVPSGTVLHWRLSGTGIDNADFSAGTIFGTGVVDATGQFVVTHTLSSDKKTEGTETLAIGLFADVASTTPLAVASVSIQDTSVASAPATYSIQPSALTLNEGQVLTTLISTTNVPDGTILYYQLGGSISPLDFSVGTISGQLIVTGGKAAFSHTLKNDLTTEGDETLTISLFSDRPGGAQVGGTVAVTIKDTSLTVPVATEIYQPQFTPFAVKKWASPVPVPTLKRPDYVGAQQDIWGTKFAPQPSPGGQPALYQDVDPTQSVYGGIAPEFYNQTVAGTTTPYYSTGASTTAWYSQREMAQMQVVVDGATQNYLTEIYGYDGTMPGSTFKTRVGQPVVVRHWNDLPTYPGMPAELPQREGVHLHGGHNPAHTDGYPSFVINPGMYRDYYYANTVPMGRDGKPDMSESPSTMWYHDHGEDITDLNVVKGLAAFWLSFDDRELELIKNHVLPGWWKDTAQWNEQEFMANNSPYDIPLAVSDRRFNADGSFFYDGFPIGKDTDGYLGDIMLVNGKSYPYLNVEQTQYRLRFLGASTARIWRLSIQDENGVMQSHLRVGNDTWLLPNPIAMKDFIISPAQRADVVMDFSGYSPGTVLYVVNTAEQTSGTGAKGNLDTVGSTGFSERIMKIVVGAATPTTPTNTLSTTTLLRENTPILASEISNRRTFEFGRSNGLWLINQTHFENDISNAPMPLGVAEEWKLINGSGGWWHPIHIHLESHQVKDINGRAPGPDYFPEKQFKSDTTLLGPNTSATVWMKFRTFEGPFVFHCHILQHEDSMMMFNFDPNLDGATYKAGDPIPADRNYTPYPFSSAHHPGHPKLGPTVAPVLPATANAQAVAAAAPVLAAVTSSPAQGGAPASLSPALLTSFPFSAWGQAAGDVMQATTQNSYLNGRDGNDYLRGDIGHDMLVGGNGDDVISGGAGDDLIAGEIGSDILTGGAGRDGFFFISADRTSTDLITDFQPGLDFISLNFALVNTNGAAQSSWSYVGSGVFTGKTGEVRFSNGLLQCDLNGDRFSDINVQLLGIKTFDQAWLNVPTVTV